MRRLLAALALVIAPPLLPAAPALPVRRGLSDGGR
jgi:hypothetical protein